MNDSLYLIVTIVDKGKGRQVGVVYHETGLSVKLMMSGFGTASSEIMDYLGLDEPKKDVVLGIIPSHARRRLFQTLDNKLNFAAPGTGIAFTVPISRISNLLNQKVAASISQPAENPSKQEHKMSNSTIASLLYEVIICISRADDSDIIMKYAREAGARGGTVIKAKELSGSEKEKNIFGFFLEPEREIIFLLVPTAIKSSVMSAIHTGYQTETGKNVGIFALPVGETTIGRSVSEIMGENGE